MRDSQASAWGMAGIPVKEGYHTAEWKSAGKFGPNRWMVEMAIPFATLKKRPAEKGLSTPARGEVFGLKLVRWGAEQQDPSDRMVSTWNTDISYPFLYIVGMNGLLYFDDSNALRDGGFTMPVKESPWKREGDIQPIPQSGLSLAKVRAVSQTAEVRRTPSTFSPSKAKGRWRRWCTGETLS